MMVGDAVERGRGGKGSFTPALFLARIRFDAMLIDTGFL
jgi:hypothetical protein